MLKPLRIALLVVLCCAGLATSAVHAAGGATASQPAASKPAPSKPTASKSPGAAPPHPREKTLMKREWGVEILYVRWVVNGYILEFRYKVLDASKARPLFDRSAHPLLTAERTGATFIVPSPGKVGALRNSDPPINGRTYWMSFANPAQYVKRGEKVTIQIGAFRAEGLVVQ